jgi:hypothetical protein
MSTLNVMFRLGENELSNVEWELLDTPPARAWRRMVDFTNENGKEHPLHVVESVFCGSKEEATALWDEVRGHPHVQGTPYGKATFRKIKPQACMDLINRLQRLIRNGVLKNVDQSYEVRDLIDKLKRVRFFMDFVHDSEFPNEDSGNGHISFIPDPLAGMDFEPSWMQYLTMATEPGTLYADLFYKNMSWHRVIEYDNIEETYEPIKFQRYGPPTLLGSGFYMAMHADMAHKDGEIAKFFFDHYNMIKFLDPDFDPVYALDCCGRIPVAKLLTPLGTSGYPGYEQLQRVTELFKIEVYE